MLDKRETQYLRFMARQGRIRPVADKVVAIRQHPLPQTLKQLRSFLDFTNYYRCFIRDFSEKTAPLTELTKGCRNPIRWNSGAIQAFEQVKIALCQHPVLYMSVFKKMFFYKQAHQASP